MASCKHLMSSMTAELIDKINSYRWSSQGITYHRMILPDPAGKQAKLLIMKDEKLSDCARLLRIQSRKLLFFHSLNVLPWVNHIAVPSWWVSQAMLWLMVGFGGESHARSFSRDWLPVGVFQPEWKTIAVPENDKRCNSSVAIFTQNRERISRCGRRTGRIVRTVFGRL